MSQSLHPQIREIVDEVYVTSRRPEHYHLLADCASFNNSEGNEARDLSDVEDTSLSLCPRCKTDPLKSTADPSAKAPGKVPGATREKVLDGVEFENLLIGAGRTGMKYDQEAWACIIMLGRLGLRRGELAHFSASWVDRRKETINVPQFDPCTNGRDGGICGSCKQAVKQAVTYSDESFEEIAETYWQPKTEASVRTIPYHFSNRTRAAVEFLLEEYGGWPHSYHTVQRRIDAALEVAPGLDEGSTTPHGLRGTAASYHAGNGLDWQALKTMMGWRDNDTPKSYLSIDGAMTRRALSEVYSHV